MCTLPTFLIKGQRRIQDSKSLAENSYNVIIIWFYWHNMSFLWNNFRSELTKAAWTKVSTHLKVLFHSNSECNRRSQLHSTPYTHTKTDSTPYTHTKIDFTQILKSIFWLPNLWLHNKWKCYSQASPTFEFAHSSLPKFGDCPSCYEKICERIAQLLSFIKGIKGCYPFKKAKNKKPKFDYPPKLYSIKTTAQWIVLTIFQIKST